MSEKEPKRKIRFTRLGYWLLFLACFLLFAAQNTGNSLYYLISSSIFTAICISLADIILTTIGFKSELSYPKIALIGQTIDIVCKIAKNTLINRYFLRFEDSWLEKIEKGSDGYLKKEVFIDKKGLFEFNELSVIKPSMLDIFYFQYIFPKITINAIENIENSSNKIFVKKTIVENNKKVLGKEGEFYGLKQYHEGDDASRINWVVSSRSLEEWIVVREKDEEEKRIIDNSDDFLTSNAISKKQNIVFGKKYKDLVNLCWNKKLDKFVYRLMISMALLVCIGIFSIGLLRYLIPFLTILFIVFGIKGSAVDNKYNNLFYAVSLLVGFYILFKSIVISSGSKIIILLEFSLLILLLQSMTMNIIRNVLGGLNLVFMILLGIAAIDIDSAFPAIFLPFLIFASMIMSFFRINLVSVGAEAKSSFSASPKGIMGSIILLIIFSFLWIPFFYLIPRTNSLGIGTNLADRKNTKGFSRTLSLNDSSSLGDNQAIVMRIIPSNEKSKSLSVIRRMGRKLIREGSFSVYDKGEWKKSRSGMYVRDLRRTSGNLILDREFDQFDQLYDFDILLEGSDNPIAFVPEDTKKLNFQLWNVGMEMDQSIFFIDRKSLYNKRYIASIYLDKTVRKNSDIDSLKPYIYNYMTYRYFSKEGISDRILELAKNLSLKDSTIDGRVKLVMDYLRGNCSYSLEQPKLEKGVDPADYFLFENKKGNCQHYATAMTLLLRAMDIPCRVVNGYLIGDWNAIGGFFAVREKDAHTWVEVFYPEYGWIPFDSTPPEEPEEQSYIRELFDNILDIYEGYWFTYVYSFDNKSQNNFIKLIFSKIWNLLTSRLLWIFLIFLAFIFMIFKKYIIGFFNYYKSSRCLPLCYYIWESGMRVHRKNSETPREYHNRLLSMRIINNNEKEKLKFVEQYIDEYAFKKGSNKAQLSKAISILLSKISLPTK